MYYHWMRNCWRCSLAQKAPLPEKQQTVYSQGWTGPSTNWEVSQLATGSKELSRPLWYCSSAEMMTVYMNSLLSWLPPRRLKPSGLSTSTIWPDPDLCRSKLQFRVPDYMGLLHTKKLLSSNVKINIILWGNTLGPFNFQHVLIQPCPQLCSLQSLLFAS